MADQLPDLLILHEDNHVLGVLKPAGLPVQGDETGDASLVDTTREWLRIKYQKPGNVYCGLVHRLDRPASGVVCLAKTSKAAGRLSEQFREKSTLKIYRVVVEGRPARERGLLEDDLFVEEVRRVTRRARAGEKAQHAELWFEMLRSTAGMSELSIELRTGRKHQIRCQLALMGCPVVGDVKYGAREGLFGGRAIALHAERLEITHPTREERIVMTAPLPDYWPVRS